MILVAAGVAIMMNMSIEPWRAINDGVMGGISSGGMVRMDEGLRFEGALSLQNNGGFSSVRRPVNEDLTQSSGIRLSVRGDGRRYQFRLRMDQNFDDVAWRQEFPTDGTIQVIEMDYADFEPVFRGRKVAGAGALDPARIRQLGFLIADKIEGAFSLEILRMEILPLNPPQPPPGN